MGRAERRREAAKERKNIKHNHDKNMAKIANIASEQAVLNMINEEIGRQMDQRVRDQSWQFFICIMSMASYILHNMGMDRAFIDSFLEAMEKIMNDEPNVDDIREYVKKTIGIDLSDKGIL